MPKCPDCGCGMSGGFCSNCHEEVFIVAQNSEMGIESSAELHQAANAHINDKDRQKTAKKQRNAAHNSRRQEEIELYGESKLSELKLKE